ncbi:MAG: sulfotransferase domain-containing protein [Desulfobacterales bacterium]|nr:sulfotransferase domain-containing protein [Desulfobacterales bacterium]
MDLKGIKPDSVILWGIGDFAKEYVYYLNEASIKLAACVDINHHGEKFRDIEILSPEEFCKNRVSFTDFPIIPTGRNKDNVSEFYNQCSEIINHYGIKDFKILHPSFLADFIDMNYQKKPVVIGFPGVGNQLFRAILTNLYQKPSISHNSKEQLFDKLAREHIYELKRTLDQAFFIYMDDNWSIAYPTSITTIYYSTTAKDGMITIDGLQAKPFLSLERIYQTHEVLNEEVVNHFKRFNNLIFFMIRHPLDILVSVAFKLTLFQEDRIDKLFYPELANDLYKSDSILREQWGLSRLNKIDWFEPIAITLRDYLINYLNVKQNVFTVRYEGLTTDPIENIFQICCQLNIDKSRNEIEMLWKKLGFKPIKKGGHYFRPGYGKWRLYFTKNHLDVLKKLGYDELLNELNYDVDWDHNILNPPAIVSPDKRLASCMREVNDVKTLELKTPFFPFSLEIRGKSSSMIEAAVRAFITPTAFPQHILSSTNIPAKPMINLVL